MSYAERIASLCRGVAQDRALREFARIHPRLAREIAERTITLELELRRYADRHGGAALERRIIEEAR
jgi:hypothetical protein